MSPRDLLVLSSVHLLQVTRVEEFRKDVLPDADQEEERQGEENPGYRYPSDAEAQHEIEPLEDGEGCYRLEGHRLYKRSMIAF